MPAHLAIEIVFSERESLSRFCAETAAREGALSDRLAMSHSLKTFYLWDRQ